MFGQYHSEGRKLIAVGGGIDKRGRRIWHSCAYRIYRDSARNVWRRRERMNGWQKFGVCIAVGFIMLVGFLLGQIVERKNCENLCARMVCGDFIVGDLQQFGEPNKKIVYKSGSTSVLFMAHVSENEGSIWKGKTLWDIAYENPILKKQLESGKSADNQWLLKLGYSSNGHTTDRLEVSYDGDFIVNGTVLFQNRNLALVILETIIKPQSEASQR